MPVKLGFLMLAVIVFDAHSDQKMIRNYSIAKNNYFWTFLYADGGNTLYCNQSFSRHRTLHIEHVYAAKWMVDYLGCSSRAKCRNSLTVGVRFNQMEADLHNLYPAMAGMNLARSNYKFGSITGEFRQLDSCDFEVDTNREVIEPSLLSGGMIARSLLYMQSEYGLPIDDTMETTLNRWDQESPPSTFEIDRNYQIYLIQRTRNKFIDAHD